VAAWLLAVLLPVFGLRAETFRIEVAPDASPRVVFGAARLADALVGIGLVQASANTQPGSKVVRIGVAPDAAPGREGFTLTNEGAAAIRVVGGDASGALYGCLELASRIRAAKGWPGGLQVADKPAFVLRGPCIGMQKPFLLPGRKVYEYPYTPESFPFFYDKAFWREYLDYLVGLRMNTLYLWNGHPFASLVRLPDYPEAVEVSDEVFARNVEMFRYIAQEADRRGIWIVQQFYSILLSKPFAEKHGLSTQLDAPTPLANINQTGFIEPPPVTGDTIKMADAFYDVTHPARRALHRAYIRQCLANLADETNVIHTLSAENSGPLHFMQFWLDVVAEWESETGKRPLMALSAPKDVQDAILADAKRAALIDVIDLTYWWRTDKGDEFAPLGGQSLAPRQHERRWKGGKPSAASIAEMAREYRGRFPGKAVISGRPEAADIQQR